MHPGPSPRSSKCRYQRDEREVIIERRCTRPSTPARPFHGEARLLSSPRHFTVVDEGDDEGGAFRALLILISAIFITAIRRRWPLIC